MVMNAATPGAPVRVVALSDGRAGNARQALALAAALSAGPVDEVRLDARAPWRWLAPRRLPGAARAWGADFDALLAAPPAVAVGCGRQAALATRVLPRHWDVVVAPEHDRLQGANVVAVAGSLHPVDEAWLARGRGAFPALGALPGPRIAVLVGGPSAHARFDVAAFDALAAG